MHMFTESHRIGGTAYRVRGISDEGHIAADGVVPEGAVQGAGAE
jgi:hypothetical protein